MLLYGFIVWLVVSFLAFATETTVKNSPNVALKTVVTFTCQIAVVLVNTISTALVFQYLWAWFYVPLGAPAVGGFFLMGVFLLPTIVGFRLIKRDGGQRKAEDESGYTFAVSLHAWIAVLIGWLIHTFLSGIVL